MKSWQRLVSVVVPAYQHEAYIRECLESIMVQTYPSLELIVIDDASTDGTFAVAESMREACEKCFVRTVIMTKEKGGIAAACNAGLALAEGEYVYMLASDDAALPQSIERLASVLDSNPACVLAVGDNAFFNAESRAIGWDGKRNSVPLEEARFKTMGDFLGLNVAGGCGKWFGTYAALLKGNHVPNGYLIRRSALLRTGGYNAEAILEDWYMNLQLAKLGCMIYVPEVLFRYRWHDRNTILNYASEESKKKICRKICSMEKEYALRHGYGTILNHMNPDSLRNRYHEARRRVLNIINKLFYINIHKRKIRLFRFEITW